jgi:hypothetical protein
VNPEEEFALMRDRSLWKVAPLRARTLPAKQSPWFMQLVVPVVTAAVVATLVIVGINGLRDATPLPPAVVTPSPTPTPTGTPTLPPEPETPAQSLPWQSPPSAVFGGDCAAVFTGDEISEILDWDIDGPDVRGSAAPDVARTIGTWPREAVLRHNSGLECSWSSPADYDGEWLKNPRLVIQVAPASAAVDYDEPEFCDDAGEVGCPFAFEFNGYFLSGRLNKAADIQSTLQLLESTFAQRVATLTTVPGAFTPQVDAWPTEIDCEAFASNETFASAAGEAPYTGRRFEPDDWYLIDTALARGHGETWCDFESDPLDEGDPRSLIGIDVLSGGAWLRSEVEALPDVEPVDVSGADAAMIVTTNPGEGDVALLYVFVGANLFTTGSDLVDFAPAMIAALNDQ